MAQITITTTTPRMTQPVVDMRRAPEKVGMEQT
jgi:hypothetical protein